MELLTRLLEQARTFDERRLLVLSGSPARTRDSALEALESIDVPVGETTYVGPAMGFQCESLGYNEATRLLGTTRTVVVVDCHARCEPNLLGKLVGTVDGGGLFVLLTPPLSTWPERRDEFDETLAIPPFDRSDVTGRFREWLIKTLRQHRGVALVDVDSGRVDRDGLVDPQLQAAERSQSDQPRSVPPEHAFPTAAYGRCLTDDQVETLSAFESLRAPDSAVVVEANRGRGKSSVAGLAAGSLALDGQDVLVTAPRYRNCQPLFERARELLDARDARDSGPGHESPRCLETRDGSVQYLDPVEVGSLRDTTDCPDCLLVDEAAALPVRLLSKTLDVRRVGYTTTTHGYEGAGRGFTVRFRDQLEASSHDVVEQRMTTPIRYAPGDPVELWSFRALALGASPPVEDVVADATPESVEYRVVSSDELLADESLLREVFGLLVLAHYRTEPNDLARLLDAPNVSVHGLFQNGHPVSVALLAREGGLSTEVRRSMYEGSRVRGNLIPDVLTSQLRDEQAGETAGLRVMRLATHSAVRSRGLGSALLTTLFETYTESDWFGVGYGATPDLLRFWRTSGFETVHLSTTQNQRSGEHSAIMLRPTSVAGTALLDRHRTWFLQRLPDMLADALRAVDPDVVREACRSVSQTTATTSTQEFDLTEWEWRHAAAVAAGPGIFEMAPRPIRTLTMHALLDESGPELSPTQEHLLVMRVLQLRPREEVASELGYHSASTCMRELGTVVGTLLDAYGPELVERERERFRN